MAVRRVNGSGDDVKAASAAILPDWAQKPPESSTGSDETVTGSDQGVKVRRVKLAKVRSARGANPR